MDCSAASAYVYAKAGGMLAKSFIGRNAAKLFSVKSVRDLHSLLFPGDVPALPESILAREVEARAEKRFLSQYISLVKNYSSPAEILISLLHSYDYENLKSIGAALALEERNPPEISDIGEYSFLSVKNFPDIQKITANSPVSWYNRIPAVSEQHEFDSRLDSQYVDELWEAVQRLPQSERGGVSSLVKAEISAMNVVWALRLKVYYKMPSEEIRKKLAVHGGKSGRKDEFSRDAIAILDKDTGSFSDWKDWKFSRFLNPHDEGDVWEIDPAFVERGFKAERRRTAARSFHKNPMSVLSLVAWFKIKQGELDDIRAVAEGLRLDMDGEQLMNAAGYGTNR